jgi:hypothetical protein
MASVCLLVGGTFQGITQYPAAAAADLVIYADVQSEVSSVGAQSSSDVLTLRLATGETLGTLTKDRCSAGLKRFLEERSGVNLSVGLGQLRAVGALVAEQLVADPAFQEFMVKQVFERLLQLHHGCLEQIVLQVAWGMAGATGSGVGPEIAKAIAKVLLEFSNATVHVEALRVGSLSFSGLGDRVHANGAATLAEDMDYVLDPQRHPREVRSMVLLENPMVGPQKTRRDTFILQLMQALRSRDVQTTLQRSSPNEALSSTFGNIRILRASFFQSLSDRRMAAEVARAYELDLDDVLRAGLQAGVGEEIGVKLAVDSMPHLQSVQQLADQIRRAKGVLPPNMLTDCLQSPVRYVCERILVSVPGEMQVNLRNLLTTSSASRSQLAEKLSVLKALHFHLQRHLQERAGPLAKAKKLSEMAGAQVKGMLTCFFPETWFDRLLAFFNNPQSMLVQFQNLVRTARQRLQEVARLQTEFNALQEASSQVSAELTAEQKRLRQTVELLRAVAGVAPAASLVRVGQLDQILVPLMELAAKDQEEVSEAVFRLLASCVKQITMSGLAAVVGARETRAFQVAMALSQAKAATKGPAWGGKRHLGAMQRILVLPPMSPEDAEALRHLVGEFNGELILAFADAAQASVNAVLLEVYCPRHSEEIFTPFHVQHLRKACEEPDLFFTNGSDGKRWLRNPVSAATASDTKGE